MSPSKRVSSLESIRVEELAADAAVASLVAGLLIESRGLARAIGRKTGDAHQAFVLIPTDAKTGPIYRIVAFEDGEEAFPMGATRVINLAPFPIRLNLAGADMDPIKPGGIGMYPMVKQVDDWNMYTAKIQFGVAEGHRVDVATQSWKASTGKRDWVISRFDPATKQPVVRQYQDIPPWRKTVLPVP